MCSFIGSVGNPVGNPPQLFFFFGSSDRINGGEAMLVDTGAWTNLVGSRWVDRMDKINQQLGKATHTRRDLNAK